jgi:hypothetical protein
MKVGDRVRVQFHVGTIMDPDDPMFANREVLKRRPGEYYCVKFDGPGPYGDGIGVYHRESLWLIKLPTKS